VKYLLPFFLALLCGTAAAAPAFEDSMAQRTLACTACHGKQGRAGPDGYYPRIAGKPAGYLYNQLLNFRDGRRHYGLMARLLDPLSDAYLLEIAQYFSALEIPYAAPSRAAADAATLQRGQVLALQGDAASKLPACAKCHGQALTGVAPNTPGLLGLPRDYLNSQLGAWRTGQRKAHAPDCMAQVAQRLAPQDLAAVTSWLAAQPLPANPRAASALPAPAPMECGSASPAAEAPRTPPVPVLDQGVARGAYLVRAGNCVACHTERGGVPFAGGRAIDTPFGVVYASNLTPDKATGIGGWSADEFWRALHNGKSKDGRLLYPAFPYPNYTLVTRADADAIYAYLRSLPPVARPNTPHRLRWPYSTQAALAVWRAMYFSPADHQDDPAKSPQWNRGAYLVGGLGHCGACHAPRNALGANSEMMDLSGGLIPMQNWYAPSLTSASEAGVAGWEPAQITRLLQTGLAPRGAVLGPMAEVVQQSTQHLTAADLNAMAVFLKALPQAAPSKEADGPAMGPAMAERGAKVYTDHCAQCHGDKGEGVAGAYPALAGNRAVTLPATANLVQVVLGGGFAPATAGNPRPFGMPPFATVLSDADVAAVISHIRASWGNRAFAIGELAVGQQRSSTAP
jgi:cytochrome c553